MVVVLKGAGRNGSPGAQRCKTETRSTQQMMNMRHFCLLQDCGEGFPARFQDAELTIS
jgi:hypothetical protein